MPFRILLYLIISIHAPARGATSEMQVSPCFQGFQSTLPRGERPFCIFVQSVYGEFQSTLPRGERLLCLYAFYIHVYISIHAPARGATTNAYKEAIKDNNFNPRSREGSDRRYRNWYQPDLQFQSTLPRGERLHDLIFPAVFG